VKGLPTIIDIQPATAKNDQMIITWYLASTSQCAIARRGGDKERNRRPVHQLDRRAATKNRKVRRARDQPANGRNAPAIGARGEDVNQPGQKSRCRKQPARDFLFVRQLPLLSIR